MNTLSIHYYHLLTPNFYANSGDGRSSTRPLECFVGRSRTTRQGFAACPYDYSRSIKSVNFDGIFMRTRGWTWSYIALQSTSGDNVWSLIFYSTSTVIIWRYIQICEGNSQLFCGWRYSGKPNLWGGWWALMCSRPTVFNLERHRIRCFLGSSTPAYCEWT